MPRSQIAAGDRFGLSSFHLTAFGAFGPDLLRIMRRSPAITIIGFFACPFPACRCAKLKCLPTSILFELCAVFGELDVRSFRPGTRGPHLAALVQAFRATLLL